MAKEKHVNAARKRELIAEQMHPPTELITFLQSDDVFEAVLKVDVHDILVRR